MFVSRLSVNEFVLAPGLTILGVAAGSIVYRMPEEECPASSQAMKGMTRKRTHVLRTAYDRLEAQAKRLGASGIIGIRVIHSETAPDVWEYTVQGTAVSGCPSGMGGRPFTCTLTGQDYFALTTAGYRPVGVALGVSVYYQKFHQRVQQKIAGGSGKIAPGQNTERSDFTRGLYTARRNALTALEAEAAALGAGGVLGISVTAKRTLNRKGLTSQGMMIEFTALGTAIITASSDPAAIGYSLQLTD